MHILARSFVTEGINTCTSFVHRGHQNKHKMNSCSCFKIRSLTYQLYYLWEPMKASLLQCSVSKAHLSTYWLRFSFVSSNQNVLKQLLIIFMSHFYYGLFHQRLFISGCFIMKTTTSLSSSNNLRQTVL